MKKRRKRRKRRKRKEFKNRMKSCQFFIYNSETLRAQQLHHICCELEGLGSSIELIILVFETGTSDQVAEVFRRDIFRFVVSLKYPHSVSIRVVFLTFEAFEQILSRINTDSKQRGMETVNRMYLTGDLTQL